MRVTGGHELEEEAVAVVRQAVSLAVWRRHAQVTPLHIARAMLSAPALSGILRAACVRSYPLQPNALDLRLDLALGRLAVTHHGGDPAPSNAFVATLKRAQAHPYRRTGGAGAKVDVEKLVISVLDDPSVHRVVVCAAGFSSSQVRTSVDASSEQSNRAGWDVSASSPNPFPDMIRAGRGQPSLPDGSGCQASKAKSGAGRPAIFGGTELDEMTANIPPWLGRYKDKTRIRLTCSSTSLQADAACRRPKFTELTATNLKILCDALELRVPRHRNIVTGISSTLLRCRSGVTRRRAGANPSGSSSSTWLLFLGRDVGGKMTVAWDLARLVFGSYAEFTTLQVQGSPDIPARTSKHALKRPRSSENDDGLGGRLFKAIVENPHRVILIDGVGRLDRVSEMRIKNAIVGGGMVRGCNGGMVSLEDAIVVLSAFDFLDSRCMASSSSPWPRVKRRFNGQNREQGDAAGGSHCCHGWDLNVCAVDGKEEEDNLADEEGILNVVDGVFLFN